MTSPTRIADNIAKVRQRIATAAQKSGRPAEAITLVAVTKYVDAETTAAVIAAGCHDLGESRPQSLWSKAATLSAPQAGTGNWNAPQGDTGILPVHDPNWPGAVSSPTPIRWHLVGHLQRNKIRRTLPLVHLIQSVDSRRLLDALDEEAAQLGQSVNVLLEANISGDATKTGLPPDELEPLLADATAWPHVAIHGLMGMASLEGGADAAHRDFEQLAQTARSASPKRSARGLAGRTFDGHERRLRNRHRVRRHHGARRQRPVRGTSTHDRAGNPRRRHDPTGQSPRGGRRNAIQGEQGGALQVSVTQAPKKAKPTKPSSPCWPPRLACAKAKSN